MTGYTYPRPVCTYCGVEMSRNRYIGQYDTFSFWRCLCVGHQDERKPGETCPPIDNEEYGENVT